MAFGQRHLKAKMYSGKKKWFMISDIERKSIKGRLKEKIRHRIQKNQHTYTVWMVRTQYNCS